MHSYPYDRPSDCHWQRDHDQVQVDEVLRALGVALAVVGVNRRDGASQQKEVGDGHAGFCPVAEAKHEADVDDGSAPDACSLVE